MDKQTFQQQLQKILRKLPSEKWMGASGLSVLAASSAFALAAASPEQGLAVAAAGFVGAVGQNVLAGILQTRLDEVRESPDEDELARLELLATLLEPDIGRNEKLQFELGVLLDESDAFSVAKAIVEENPMQGWLLVSLSDDVQRLRKETAEDHAEQGEMLERIIGLLETGTTQLPKSSVPPMEIPRRVQHFHGREALIEKVLAEIYPRRVVTLHGIGGIGKTAVVAEVVGRLQEMGELEERFPDGVIFHTFYGRPSADVALEHVLKSLGVEREGELDDSVQVALGGKQLLLILDGAEEADNLERMVDLGPSCAIMISSRKKEDVIKKGFAVKRLDENDAQAVLAGWAGDRAVNEALRLEICDLVGNLPLAVRLVGRYIASSGLTEGEHLAWLRESGLEALDFGERRQESVRVLLKKSVAQVGEGARQALAMAGTLALEPFRVEPVAAALDKENNEAQKDLGELYNYGLLERPDTSYVVSHPLIHTYARTEYELDGEALLLIVKHYAVLTTEESKFGAEGFAGLDEERLHIMQLIRVCEAREEWKAVDSLVWAVAEYLDHQGFGVERIVALEAGLRAAREIGDRRGEGAHLGNLGNAYAALGQVEKAIDFYQQALLISQEIGDRRGEGAGLGNLGSAYYSLGQVDKAIDYHEQALLIAQEIGDRRSEGAHLGNLGLAYADLGQVEKAIDYHEQALLIAQEIGDRRSEGAHLGNLGIAYRNLGQVDKAIAYHEQALLISQEIGDRRGEGNRLGNLGSAYAALGQVEQAIDYYEQAMQIAQETGDRRGEGNRLGNLGLAYAALGQVEKAIDYYEQAMQIAQETGDRRGEGNRLGNLGLAYAALGQVEKAIEYHEQALLIAQEIGDRRSEGAHLGGLGLAYAALGQVEKAIDCYEQALQIAQEIGDRRSEGAGLGNLGNAYYSLGQVDKAIDFYQQALLIAQEIGDRRGEGAGLGNLGNAYYSLGQVDKAIDFYQQALLIAQEIGDRRGEGAHLGNLGLAYADLGQVEKAIDYHEQALLIAQEIGDRRSEGAGLGNLGNAYAALGQVEKAIEYAEKALEIFEEIKSPNAEQARAFLEELRGED